MNFYKHHIGDYARDTAHLNFIEDAAYSRLMRRYYSTEKPLPEDPVVVARLVGAKTKAEKAAVPAMLEEFFVLQEDGWHQKRCDEEIAVAREKANRNRESGKLGGRPLKLETQTVSGAKPTNNLNGFHLKPIDNPLQTPDSRLQKPDSISQTRQGRGEARAARSPATRIPDDFALTPERIDYAQTRGVDPAPTFEAFTLYWSNKPRDATKLDWDKTWRSWVLKDAKDTKQRNAPKLTRYDQLQLDRRNGS